MPILLVPLTQEQLSEVDIQQIGCHLVVLADDVENDLFAVIAARSRQLCCQWRLVHLVRLQSPGTTSTADVCGCFAHARETADSNCKKHA